MRHWFYSSHPHAGLLYFLSRILRERSREVTKLLQWGMEKRCYGCHRISTHEPTWCTVRKSRSILNDLNFYQLPDYKFLFGIPFAADETLVLFEYFLLQNIILRIRVSGWEVIRWDDIQHMICHQCFIYKKSEVKYPLICLQLFET